MHTGLPRPLPGKPLVQRSRPSARGGAAALRPPGRRRTAARLRAATVNVRNQEAIQVLAVCLYHKAARLRAAAWKRRASWEASGSACWPGSSEAGGRRGWAARQGPLKDPPRAVVAVRAAVGEGRQPRAVTSQEKL